MVLLLNTQNWLPKFTELKFDSTMVFDCLHGQVKSFLSLLTIGMDISLALGIPSFLYLHFRDVAH